MRIHHVGIAVEKLERAVPVFELLLGCPPAVTEEVEDQKVRTAIFRVGESRIELLEPTSAVSPISRFMDKHGPGIHHLTFSVENLQKTLVDLEGRGIRLIDTQPRRGAGGESIAFLHPSSTANVLVELLEENDSRHTASHQRQEGK
ncbi:MAG TPA: methylmalonyl-CoA epimerase [Terriglobia bacterium]|nr:methylmalonyl-CoA epimerase [Terriglobia bacterium]